MSPYFSIIFAIGPNGEFSFKNKMPWPRIKRDMEHFSRVTTNTRGNTNKQNVVIMGRYTMESLGSNPLTNRYNIVISSKLSLAKEEFGTVTLPYMTAKNLDDAFEQASKLIENGKAYKIFVIGGISLIYKALEYKTWEYIYETTVNPTSGEVLEADGFFIYQKDYNECFVKSSTEMSTDGKFELTFTKYMHKHFGHGEKAYFDSCLNVLAKGVAKSDRTGVGTVSLCGEHLSFDLSTSFPIFTTKRVFWRGVVAELLFFLSGKTDTKILEKQGVNIWKGNTSREFLDKFGFSNYNEGELGPGYSWQWRHYGAEYKPNIQLEIGQGGFDQIQWVIDSIKAVKADPSDSRGRRLVVTAWNPLDVPRAVLPPCHNFIQFYINVDKLDCIVNMRSGDLFLGVPFNVSSYALLTYMICHLVDLIPGRLILNIGDCHIYLNHIDAVKKQLNRPFRILPRLEIIGNHKSIDDFTFESLKLIGYHPHEAIKADMAV